MEDEQKVNQLAKTLFSKGLAASMWDARNKARDIMGLTSFNNAAREDSNKNSLNMILKNAGIDMEAVKNAENERIKEVAEDFQNRINQDTDVLKASITAADKVLEKKDEIKAQGVGNVTVTKDVFDHSVEEETSNMMMEESSDSSNLGEGGHEFNANVSEMESETVEADDTKEAVETVSSDETKGDSVQTAIAEAANLDETAVEAGMESDNKVVVSEEEDHDEAGEIIEAESFDDAIKDAELNIRSGAMTPEAAAEAAIEEQTGQENSETVQGVNMQSEKEEHAIESVNEGSIVHELDGIKEFTDVHATVLQTNNDVSVIDNSALTGNESGYDNDQALGDDGGQAFKGLSEQDNNIQADRGSLSITEEGPEIHHDEQVNPDEAEQEMQDNMVNVEKPVSVQEKGAREEEIGIFSIDEEPRDDVPPEEEKEETTEEEEHMDRAGREENTVGREENKVEETGVVEKTQEDQIESEDSGETKEKDEQKEVGEGNEGSDQEDTDEKLEESDDDSYFYLGGNDDNVFSDVDKDNVGQDSPNRKNS